MGHACKAIQSALAGHLHFSLVLDQVEVCFQQAGKSVWRWGYHPSTPEEVHSASSPAGVSMELSLLAGPVGIAGDWIIFDGR